MVDEPPTAGDWIYELKFDGIRAIAVKDGSKVSLISRNGNELRSRFPEIADAIKKLSIQECVIDGEVVALDEEAARRFNCCRRSRWKAENRLCVFTSSICSSLTAEV